MARWRALPSDPEAVYGRTVAVARRRQGIFLVPSHGGRARRLTARTLRPQAWSPDGKTVLATAATARAVHELVALDRESGRQHVIARGSLYGVDFSPKGDELVYSRAPEPTFEGICGDQFDLYVAKPDGSEARRLTHDGPSGFPVWGPSGIAYAHFPAGGTIADCAAAGVWTIDPDGSNNRAGIARAPDSITLAGYYGFQPLDWLDDEHVLVGLRTDSGTEGAILDVKTHKLRRLGDFADQRGLEQRLVALHVDDRAVTPKSLLRSDLGDAFGHGLGHGVGLDVHEAPRLAKESGDTLAAANVVTVEPGIYLEGLGGIRIEDLVIVGEDGPEITTGFTKDLMSVD